MATRLTASVVGAGSGGRLSMKALAASDRFDLVAVADISADARRAVEADFPGVRTFASHQEMFAACPTDVVCVSTWPPSHEQITLDALTGPLKGILVEKPLGHTAESGRRLLRAIQARRLPMATPHNLLAKATPLEIIRRVQAGEIGRLKLVEIQNTRWDIINAGIHWLNFFVVLTGNEPIRYVMAAIDASTRTYRDGMQVETTAVTYAETAGGIRVVMQTGDDVNINTAGKNTLFRLIGTGGQIEFWGWENGYRILNSGHPAGELVGPQELPVMGHQRHLERMAELIDAGATDYTIPESSLQALEICEAAYLSARHRCLVPFPLERFEPPGPVDWEPGRPYSGSGGGRDGRKLG